VFWVTSVYFNIRNTLPKSGTFLLGHPVYSHLSFDLAQDKQKNMDMLTKARGGDVFCVKEAIRRGLTQIDVPSVSTASEQDSNF